jgi:hypothetical protein
MNRREILQSTLAAPLGLAAASAFAQGESVAPTLGRMTGTFDFMPFSCKFQNITFCATLQSHGVVTNWVAFPGSTWAALARVNLKKDWYLQAGAPRTRSGPISRSGACHNLAAAHRVQAAGKVSFVKSNRCLMQDSQ